MNNLLSIYTVHCLAVYVNFGPMGPVVRFTSEGTTCIHQQAIPIR